MRLRRSIEIGVVVFFCVMIALLIARNLPEIRKDRIQLKKASLENADLQQDNWMGVYLNEKKIGYSHLSIAKAELEGKKAYLITDESFMKFRYADQSYDANINATAYVRPDLKPISFTASIFTDVYRAVIKGKVRGDIMEVEVDAGGPVVKQSFPISEATYLPAAIDLLLPRLKLEVGKPYKLDLFDPQIMSGEYMTITLKKIDRVNNDDILVVEKDYKGLISTSWINMKGEALREENSMGMKLLTESKEMALAKGKFEAGDLVSKASIPSNVFINAARNITFLELKMRGLKGFTIPSSSRQAVKDNGGEISVRINSSIPEEEKLTDARVKEYTNPSLLIQSNDPEIVNKAVEITEDDTLQVKKAERLNIWVFRTVMKVPTFSLPSASNVLKEKRGDCNEHTALLTALLRACKIPARAVTGIVYMPPSGITVSKGDKGSFFYHAWVEAYVDGKWKVMDPTFGMNNADAAHVKLLTGDIDKQTEIVRLIGKLKISVEDYK